MKQLLLLMVGLLSLSLSACTYTAAVSQTNIPSNRSKAVHAKIEKFMILGLNFENDYVLRLTSRLKEQCPQGDVRGVTTHDQATLYVLAFFWKREIEARGYCIPHKNTASLDADWGEVASAQE